jgi:hypothetical protein
MFLSQREEALSSTASKSPAYHKGDCLAIRLTNGLTLWLKAKPGLCGRFVLASERGFPEWVRARENRQSWSSTTIWPRGTGVTVNESAALRAVVN